MTDYLMVHDAGQSAWFWNKVWGYMTAPREHPPRLYRHHNSSNNQLLNLPGHGADERGDTGDVRLEECLNAITGTVERLGLRDLVLVGHGLGGLLALQAAAQLPSPPRRVVLIAGLVPVHRKSILSLYPGQVRRHFSSPLKLGRLLGWEHRLGPSFIARQLCNGMEPRDIHQSLGFYGPLPTQMLESRVALPLSTGLCPVSYLVLDRDRLTPPRLQLAMASRIPGVEVAHLDSCHQAQLHIPRQLADTLLGWA